MDFFNDAPVRRLKRVSLKAAKEFAGGRHCSTFRGDLDPDYRIKAFAYCPRCMAELPPGLSPREYGFLEVGITSHGSIQVWCKRCEVAVGEWDTAGAAEPDECRCDACAAERAILAGPAMGRA